MTGPHERAPIDLERGRAVAAELRARNAKKILIRAAEQGYITELACMMPECFCPEELGGATYFEPVNAALSDWMPTLEHFPVSKQDGGKEAVDNAILAHRLCNRIDYSFRAGRSHARDLERIEKARVEAIARSKGERDSHDRPVASEAEAAAWGSSVMDLAVYAVDVGSVSQGKLGWARAVGPDGRVDPEAEETDIRRLVDALEADVRAERPIALGFECPLYVPVPADPQRLGKARAGEGNRAWSAGAGTGALATGLVEAAWVLRSLRERLVELEVSLNWVEFTRKAEGLFLWEAFVSGTGKGASASHHGDAAIAVERFLELLPDPTVADVIDAEAPLSLIGAAALWAGCLDDPAAVHQKCLVVMATA